MPRTTCYRQWLVNYGFDPRTEGPAGEALVWRSGYLSENGGVEEIGADGTSESQDTLMVRRALMRLAPELRDLVERYYYMGQTHEEIACAMSWGVSRVARNHRLALRRLRRMLEPWVLHADAGELDAPCRICQSPNREAIEQVIRSKRADESFRRVLRIVRGRFGLAFNHPRYVIWHREQHMEDEL